jgi:Putative peptidoglycan binding domain
MPFLLTDAILRRMCEVNNFPAPTDGMIFVGLRGCQLANPDDQTFQTEHLVEVTPYDHIHPRCTICQWTPAAGTLALFPGSTVPHQKFVNLSIEKNGKGTNQMMTGYYDDYRKGMHRAGSPRAHPAFRQTEGHPIRRTADDFDYDNEDAVEFTNPYDNLHAGWSMGVNHNYFASAGCQVVVGYPECEYRGDKPDSGAWKAFKENAYALDDQQSFPYVLMSGVDAQKVAIAGAQKMSPRLRFGSRGPLVPLVQRALQELKYYEGAIDEDFGLRSTRAVLEFQAKVFGSSADDGIVGPMTAAALGITWHDV